MTFTLNDIYKQYNKLHNVETQKSVHIAVPRTETRLKMHQTCIWNTGQMQIIAGPVLASAMWTDKKKNKKQQQQQQKKKTKKKNTKLSLWDILYMKTTGQSRLLGPDSSVLTVG